MQQRRVRLGDILDDYCPRERRVTNHAVVAMVEEDVKRTRCTTCDTEHEYKHAKVPAARRRKPAAGAIAAPLDPSETPVLVVSEDVDVEEVPASSVEAGDPVSAASAEQAEQLEPDDDDGPRADDEWPVHRPLIRATLPRPEGQTPERKPTDFTIRQNSGRFEGQRNGNRSRGNSKQGRQAHGQSGDQSRFGNTRTNSGQGPRHGGGQRAGGNAQRHGNGPAPSGQRGGRSGQGGSQRPGQGRGPRRGR